MFMERTRQLVDDKERRCSGSCNRIAYLRQAIRLSESCNQNEAGHGATENRNAKAATILITFWAADSADTIGQLTGMPAGLPSPVASLRHPTQLVTVAKPKPMASCSVRKRY